MTNPFAIGFQAYNTAQQALNPSGSPALSTPTADQYSSAQSDAKTSPGAPSAYTPPQSSFVPSTITNGTATNPNPSGTNFNNAAPAGQQQTQTNPFANPSFNNYSGYNPSQYASTGTANNLATQLGGNVMQTQMAPGSPFNVPNQNMVNFGGADSLNAGLLAERYAKYDRATADAMTRAELGQMGGWNPNSMGHPDSVYQSLPGGTQNLGGGSNIGSSVGQGFNGGIGRPQAGSTAGNSAFGWGQGQGQAGGQSYLGGRGGDAGQQQFNPRGGSYGQNQSNATLNQSPYGSQRTRQGGFGSVDQFNSINNPLMQFLMYGAGNTAGATGGGTGFNPFGMGGSLLGLSSMMNQYKSRQPQMSGWNGYQSQGFNPWGGGGGFGGNYRSYYNPYHSAQGSF